jgi:calcineurin-like phosphoesterase family protein
MSRIFVIGDLHFGHRAVIKFESQSRPFSTIQEHDLELVERWNSVVRKRDTVYVLGDVVFSRDSFKYLGMLVGVKKLVLGNHDRFPTRMYLEHFSKVLGIAMVRSCALTHIPIHPWQFQRYRRNIHGHTHHNSLDDRRYINVSAEMINLTPVLLDSLL